MHLLSFTSPFKKRSHGSDLITDESRSKGTDNASKLERSDLVGTNEVLIILVSTATHVAHFELSHIMVGYGLASSIFHLLSLVVPASIITT